MANNEPKRSHVCGFVKRLKGQGTIFFTVSKRQFVLPASSTFAKVICSAKLQREIALVLYEESGKKHPKVTGVIQSPTWKQRKAAEEGLAYEAIDDLVTHFVEVGEGQYA
jgi:hypothetical protein